jgi:hypothetical protein
MNLENIILQGGSLAVVLACFIIVLQWLLKHFTVALERIEQGQYAGVLAMMGITKVIFRVSIKADSLTDEQTKQMLAETLQQLDELEAILIELKSEATLRNRKK